MITFLRRKSLGLSSVMGMTAHLADVDPMTLPQRGQRGRLRHTVNGVGWCRNDQEIPSETTLLIRWGCTSTTGITTSAQLNPSSGIQTVNDKRQFRILLQANEEDIVPLTVDSVDLARTVDTWPLVVRPVYHAQGRNLFVVSDLEDLVNVTRKPCMASGWYASELIDKVAEYRVYVVSGRVATIARKTPDNPDAVAWNVAQGGRFDVVNWGDWPLEVVKVALQAFQHTGLDFSGIDVMVDRDGRAYVIEANSAPSLPFLSDGSVSYRQKAMAKCFAFIRDNGKEHFDYPESITGWRDVIHPGVRQ